MATKLAERIKADTGRPVRVQGLPAADWVLIDTGDVIVPLFRPEVRSFYNLERMWAFGEAMTSPGADATACSRHFRNAAATFKPNILERGPPGHAHAGKLAARYQARTTQ